MNNGLKTIPSRPPQHNTHRVEVKLRAEFADAEGLSALAVLHSLGLNAAREVRTSQIYEIHGPLSSAQVQQAAKELLCDPVTQEFRLLAPPQPVSNGMQHWRVEVWLKETVTDPVAETVAGALREMGHPAPESVRVGTAYNITGKCGRHHLERIVPRSLANPVIHRFSVAEDHP